MTISEFLIRTIIKESGLARSFKRFAGEPDNDS